MGLGGLMHFGARFYSGTLGRFLSADTVVPDWANPQSLNRYSYVRNNPLRYTDPAGHEPCHDTGLEIGSEISQADCWAYGRDKWELGLAVPAPKAGEGYSTTHGILELVVKLAFGYLSTPDADSITQLNRVSAIVSNFNFKHAVALRALAYTVFALKVRTGGPWDPKSEIRAQFTRYQRVGGNWYFYDIWGNLIYGYMGVAMGFSRFELLEGAGAMQAADAIRKQEAPVSTPGVHGLRTFDDPVDQVFVQVGIRLWADHGRSLTPEALALAVSAHPDPRAYAVPPGAP